MIEPEPTVVPEMASDLTLGTETSKLQRTSESLSAHETTSGITPETEGERF